MNSEVSWYVMEFSFCPYFRDNPYKKLQIYKSENTMKCFTSLFLIRQFENDFTLGQKVKKGWEWFFLK